jgi:branched-chain amino acid transport system ATP-binding protein
MSVPGRPKRESFERERQDRPVTPMLAVRSLDAYYGKAQALFGIDLEVAPGEVVALIGRNGAGKSTLLKSMMGLVAAAGEVVFDGRRIDSAPPHARARLGLGYVPEERRIFGDLTVRENLLVGAQGRGLDLEELLRLFPNLREMLDRRAVRMSGGEQQMLALARTLAARPRLVLLDEPSEGIAPIIVASLAEAVRAMKRQGVAVLLSEQNPRFVSAVADRALLLERGRIVGAAAMDELSPASDAVRQVLGL